MSNLETLTSKSSEDILSDSNSQAPVSSPAPKRCTPDLVQDLPLVTDDISPVGSYRDSSHDPLTSSADSTPDAAVTSVSTSAESSAETFANSDGTIVRIKPTTPSSPSPPKFIGTSVATRKELTSFQRSISTSSASSNLDTAGGKEAKSTSGKARVNTVTGKAIEVRTPSIPSGLHSDEQRPGSREAPVMSHSLPTSPTSDPTPPFPSVAVIDQALCSASSKETTTLHSSDRHSSAKPTLPAPSMTGSYEKKFDKPRPPVKTKPKPPALLPKPKK